MDVRPIRRVLLLGAYGQDAETPNVELTYTLVSQQPEFGTISQDPDYGGLRFKPTQEFLDSIYKGKDATFSYDFTVSDGQYTTDVKTATFTVYGEETRRASCQKSASRVPPRSPKVAWRAMSSPAPGRAIRSFGCR
ncbi:Ig-like domain-containing protein [Microvirga aerilata]|uniref:Ig-like domain-containing protein n=1 Tax=Microvirga aerilata TaxID=670292 RepID=UPI00363C9288